MQKGSFQGFGEGVHGCEGKRVRYVADYSYSVRANLFAELPIIKPCPQKVEPWLKVISEPEDNEDNKDNVKEDEEMPRKRPKTTCVNCRSSSSFIVSNKMKWTILMLEGKMLTVCRYLKELQGHTSTVKMFIASQQADLEDLKVAIWI